MTEHHIVGGNMGGMVVLDSKRAYMVNEVIAFLHTRLVASLAMSTWEEWNIWATKQQEMII